MNVQNTLGMTALLSALVTLSACAGQTPTTAVPRMPTSERHLQSLTGVHSFAALVAQLPAKISLKDAQHMLMRIDLHHVTPIIQSQPRGQRRLQQLGAVLGRGWGVGYGFGALGNSMYGMAPASSFGACGAAFTDSASINCNVEPQFASQMGSLSYLPQDNMLFPYAQTGDCMQPYVVDRQRVPFFVEKDTVAVPQVTQVAQQVTVPRTVIGSQQVTVQQPVTVANTVQVPTIVNVPTQVNVPQTVLSQATVPVETTVPFQTTVYDQQTVMTPQINTTLTQSTSVVGPCGQIVPMEFNPQQ